MKKNISEKLALSSTTIRKLSTSMRDQELARVAGGLYNASIGACTAGACTSGCITRTQGGCP